MSGGELWDAVVEKCEIQRTFIQYPFTESSNTLTPDPIYYRVTHQVVQNILLTSKQEFTLAWPDQAKTEILF